MIWLDQHQLRFYPNHNNHKGTRYARQHNSTHTKNQNQQLQLIMQSCEEKITLISSTARYNLFVLEVNDQ